MKLIMAVINAADEKEVNSAMLAGGFYVTKIGSSGGIMRNKLVTLFSAVHDDKKDEALSIIEKSTHSKKYNAPRFNVPMGGLNESAGFPLSEAREVVVGGASVFVLDILEYRKY